MPNITFDDISAAIYDEVETALHVLDRATNIGLMRIDLAVQESFDMFCIDILLVMLLLWSCASCSRVPPSMTTGELIRPEKHHI